MFEMCNIFAASTCIQFWKPSRLFRCLCILVAMCALSVVLILRMTIDTNRMWNYQITTVAVFTRVRYDNSRKYVIQDSAFVGGEWRPLTSDSQKGDVCLATQASIEMFHHMIDSGNYWKGPMSIAIFTPGIEHQIFVIYLQYLARCFQDIMQNVSIHSVFPVDQPPIETSNLSSFSIDSFDCSRRKELLEQLLARRPSWLLSWRQGLHYPQNLMRNVARKSCRSEYVVLTDVDIVPSSGMCQVLSRFVATRQAVMCRCCAFVIPTYEIEKNSMLPGNKKELLEMVAHKTARSYRVIAHKPNQAATNVSVWEALPVNGVDITSIGYQLPKFRFGYEPFYLSKDDVPPHDERFVGYGNTRNTQVYEMQMGGYGFFVLDNVFLIHPGMAGDKKSQKRVKETLVSFLPSRKFLYELKVKYARYSNDSFVDNSFGCRK